MQSTAQKEKAMKWGCVASLLLSLAVTIAAGLVFPRYGLIFIGLSISWLSTGGTLDAYKCYLMIKDVTEKKQ